MSTELYKAIKTLKGENLDQEDKEELLRFFVVTKSSVVRNQIAFILSDAKPAPTKSGHGFLGKKERVKNQRR